jgi:hypothetical protein
VVKWYTRYFEGVVGVSLCEFESHLPHEFEGALPPENPYGSRPCGICSTKVSQIPGLRRSRLRDFGGGSTH